MMTKKAIELSRQEEKKTKKRRTDRQTGCNNDKQELDVF